MIHLEHLSNHNNKSLSRSFTGKYRRSFSSIHLISASIAGWSWMSNQHSMLEDNSRRQYYRSCMNISCFSKQSRIGTRPFAPSRKYGLNPKYTFRWIQI